MDTTLPLDSHILGYWGLDEANADDVGLDRSEYGNPLLFTTTAAPQVGKVGNARFFDGSSTQAAPTAGWFHSSDSTLLVWATLLSVNSVGSGLRTIIACDAPGTTFDENTVFALAVDATGAIVYRYDRGSGVPVVFRTAAGVFPVNRFHFVAIERTVDANECVVRLTLNGEPHPWESCTVDGVAYDPALAVPSPQGGEEAALRVGISAKATDSHWHGLIDELSVHDVPRGFHPYIRAAYLRTALFGTYTRLTDRGGIRALAVTDLGGGARWWCFVRERTVFVIRENALGAFGPEVQLTTGGTQPNGAPALSGITQVALAYSATTNTLVVAFLAAGKVFKLTADDTDEPVTQNMPLTVDTATIIKAQDSRDYYMMALSGTVHVSPRTLGTSDTYTDTPAAPVIGFFHTPAFGLALVGGNPHGYAVFREAAGVLVELGRVTQFDASRPGLEGRYHFFPLPDRIVGLSYRAVAIRADGTLAQRYSNSVFDAGGEMGPRPPVPDVDAPVINRDGDLLVDEFTLGGGVGPRAELPQSTRNEPLKFGVGDTGALGAGGTVRALDGVSFVYRTPLKLSVADAGSLSVGGGTLRTIRRTNQLGVS